MKVLGYIGSYNEPVDRTLDALLAQTYPVRDIVVVDNASAVPVAPATASDRVTVVRVARNIGPNSAVAAGLQHALDHGYEWMWLLESDGAPHPDALENLVQLYDSLPAETQSRVGVLCCTQVLLPTTKRFHGRRLTPGGPRLPHIDPALPYCEVDAVLWNGALFNMDAVRAVGLPRLGRSSAWEDLSYDYGDTEYTYRIKAAGYHVLVHRSSLIDQRVGRSRQVRVLGRPWITTNHPESRRYLFFRNLLYFWVHVYPRRNWPLFGTWFLYRLTVILLGVVLLEDRRLRKIVAAFRGIWDGLRGDLRAKY